MSKKLVDFVIQQLPQDEDKELLKNLAAEFDKGGAEAVKKRITAMIDALQEA